jgi:hypothetical protein
MDKLESMGYSDWFRSKVDTEKAAAHELEVWPRFMFMPSSA